MVVAADGAGEFAAELRVCWTCVCEPSSRRAPRNDLLSHYPQLLGDESFAPAAILSVWCSSDATLSHTALLERTDIQCAFYAPRHSSWYEPSARSFVELSTPHEPAEFACASAVAAEPADELTGYSSGFSRSRMVPARHLPPTNTRVLRVRLAAITAAGWHSARAASGGMRWLSAASWCWSSSNLVRDLDAAAPAPGRPAPRARVCEPPETRHVMHDLSVDENSRGRW